MDDIIAGKGKTIIMGYKGLEETKDIQSVRYIAPILPGKQITGYYKVISARWTELPNEKYLNEKCHIRITFDVADWTPLENPAKYGLVEFGFRGDCKTKDEFFKHCKEQAVVVKM